MADHGLPITTTAYATVLTALDARLDDLARWNSTVYPTPTNLPDGSVRWNATTFKWEKQVTGAWGTDFSTRYDININGTVGATTPSTGAFTTLSTSGVASLANNSTMNGVVIVNLSATQTLTNKTIGSGSSYTGGVIAVTYGGTGAASAPAAPFALKGANTDLTSFSALANFGNTSTTHVRVSTTGLVGLNTVADTGVRLHVKDGNAIIKSEGTAGFGSFYALSSTGQPSYMFFGTAAAETARIAVSTTGSVSFYTGPSAVHTLTIDNTGLVGIGTASAGNILEVTKNQNAITSLVIRNTDVGASSGTNIRIIAGTKYINQYVDYTNSYFAIQGLSGITTKYEDFDTQVWRNNAGTERLRLNSLGALWLGSSSPGAVQFANFNSITGAVYAYSHASNPTVLSDVTSGAYGFNTYISTQAAAFTLANLVHFGASQGVFGAGSVVTSQFGFRVESNFTGAANNYAFLGEIAAATGRWNLYMSGTANNYLAGKLGVGASPGGAMLTVSSTGTAPASFTNTTAASYAEVNVSSNDRSLVLGQRSSTHGSGELAYIYCANAATPFGIFTGGTMRLQIQAAGHAVPGVTNTYTLGSASLLWSNVYATLFTGPVTALKSATTSVNVSSATAPTTGQVLTATGSTTATWQTAGLGTYYSSADETITPGSVLSRAHSLTAKPRLFKVTLKCTDAGGEAGYAQNEECQVFDVYAGVSIIQMSADASNVTLSYYTASGTPIVLHKSTWAPTSITASKWKFVMRAWL